MMILPILGLSITRPDRNTNKHSIFPVQAQMGNYTYKVLMINLDMRLPLPTMCLSKYPPQIVLVRMSKKQRK